LKRISYLFLLVILIFKTGEVYAQWSTDPNNNLIVGYGLLPELCSDSAGGCYITYEQNLTYPRHLILERLNRYGYKPWGSGKQITGLLEEQSSAKITEDGYGGVIVSYLDIYDNHDPYNPIFYNRLRVQRVDSGGNFLWGPNGVSVSRSETNQSEQTIVDDGMGGCIVVWSDTLSKLRAQRTDNIGSRCWSDSGIELETNTQYSPKILKTAENIFVIAYGASLKKIDIDGHLSWPQSINVGFGTRSIASDLEGNVIVFDAVGSPENIIYVAQKFDSLGVVQWQNPYVVLAESTIFSVYGYTINVVNKSEIIVTWQKSLVDTSRIYAQRISSMGSIQWQKNGINVSKISSIQELPKSVSGEENNIIFSWRDSRGGIFAQKNDMNGYTLWDTTDILICKPLLTYEKVTTDRNGGLIIIGSRDDFSIRAQQVSRNGKLGEIITNVNFENDIHYMENFVLYQNYPNPFNSGSSIKFDIPKNDYVKMDIYNLLGQYVKTLVNQYYEAGKHIITMEGGELSSGIYFYKMQTSKQILVRKLTIIK
jgi:hypothetical protein